jgi:hypothetical protein
MCTFVCLCREEDVKAKCIRTTDIDSGRRSIEDLGMGWLYTVYVCCVVLA